MKKWLVAIVCIVALCLVACCASAAGLVLKDENGRTLADGDSLDGQFYYKVYMSGLPSGSNAVYCGWNEDMNATGPYEWESEPRQLSNDNDGKGPYLMIIPDPFDDYDQEIMFVKTSENAAVRHIELHYNRDPISTSRPRILTRNAPTYEQDDFSLSWTSVNGAFYFVQWTMANGEKYLFSTPETDITIQDPSGPLTDIAGDCVAQVVPLVDGHIGQMSDTKHYWIDPPESDGMVWLGADRLDENSSDNQIYIAYGESVNYRISAPGADEVRFINGEWIDENIVLDENGYTEYFWMPSRDDWRGNRTYVAFVQARYGEDWVTSNSICTNVRMDGEITGDIDWSIQSPTPIPRDKLLTISASMRDGEPDEEIDFFAAYIPDPNNNDNWLADSHWVDANHDGPTTITLPVAACPNGTYDVYVYAIRLGSPNKETTQPQKVTVTNPTANKAITISMKDSYETGEPIRIRAYYSNPENLENAWMHVTIGPKPGENEEADEWYSEGKGFDFWDDFQIDWRGTYVVNAWICQDVEGQEEAEEVEGTRTTFEFTVTATEGNELDEPSVSMSEISYRGDRPVISFEETPNAEHYGYWMHREENNDNLMNDGDHYARDFILDTNQLEPGIYWVETDVTAHGYQAAHKTLYFALLDSSDIQRNGDGYYFATNAGNAGYNEEGYDTAASTGDGVRFIFFAPGAEQVQLLEFDENEQECQIEHAGGPGVVGWMTWDEPGVHRIYGKVYSNGDWGDPVLLTTVGIQGQLGEPNVDMPMIVNAGEDVKITFNGNDGATYYSYWLAYEGDRENSANLDINGHINKAISKPTRCTINEYQLEANRVYRVYLDVSADGFSGHSEQLLYVLGDDTQGIWLDVPETISVGNAFEVRAGAQGAQDIHIRWDSADDDLRSRYGEDHIDDGFGVDNPGLQDSEGYSHFTAFARVNDNELLVTRAQAAVTGVDENTDYCTTPTISITNDEVERNGFIYASVGYNDEDDDETNEPYEYHVNIFEKNEDGSQGERRNDYCFDHGGDLLIPTSDLQEGEYLIGAWVRVSGMYSASTPANMMATATITECQEQFYISKNVVQVCEPLTVSICAPGAERIRFSSGYDRWDDENGQEGDSWYSDNICWNYSADTVTMRAEAMYNGNWELIGTKRVRITKEGDLAEPDLSGIQTTTTAGEDMDFTFPAVEHAEWYDFDLISASNGEQWSFRGEVAGNTVTGTIPADCLEEENVGYTLRIHACGTGYNASHGEVAFVTVPADATEQISLEADCNEVESNNGDVNFTVTAEGATLVRIYHEDMWNWAPTDENGVANFSISFNHDILQPVWATACYDAQYGEMSEEALYEVDMDTVPFEGMSNVVNISVSSRGETMMPGGAWVPEEVTWGEWLPVNIEYGGNAEVFHIRIWDAENNREIKFKEVNTPGNHIMQTMELVPDHEYYVTIDGCCPGFTWNGMGEYYFTVLPREEGEEPEEPYMVADREWTIVEEPYYVMMYAPGAVQLMAVNANNEEDVNATWDGPYGESDNNGFWWTENETGYQTLKGLAQYPADDDHPEPYWEEIGSVTLLVLNRQLDKPEIRVDSVVDGSQDINITVPVVLGGSYYSISIHDTDYNNTVYGDSLSSEDAIYAENDEGQQEGLLTFTVPADTLQDGKGYWVDCNVNSNYPGVEGNWNSRAFLVNNGETDSKIALSVTKTEILINEEFTVVATAPGARAILIRFGDQWRGYMGSYALDRFSEWQACEETLYAQAFYDEDYEFPENLNQFDWLNNVEWDKPSEAITLRFIEEGQVGKPGFEAPDTIRRGDILTISNIYEGDGANETHANILNNPDDGYESWVFDNNWQVWNERTHEIYLSTNDLEAGRTYWLAVDNSGIGLSGNRTWHEFEVYEDDEQLEDIVFDAPDSVMLGDAMPVSIYAPGAWRIGFAVDGDKWHEDRYGSYMWGYFDWWCDAENLRWENPDDIGEHTITAYVQYYGDEEWVTINKTVQVIDPSIDEPEIRVNPVVSNTSALNIVVPLVEHGVDYYLDIHIVNRSDEESYLYHGALNATEADQNGLLTFTVPAGTLPDGNYWIDCYVSAERPYNDGDGHQTILVRNSSTATDSNITLEVDRTEVAINDDFTVTASAPGAYAIIIRCGDHSWGYLGDSVNERFSEWSTGYESLYAQACYVQDPDLPEGFVWNFDWSSADIEWSNPSEMIQMHFISYGPAGEADYDAPIVVVRGDVLKVTDINLGDGANEAHANINVNGPGEEEIQVYGYGWHSWDENARAIYMSTSMLEPGNYWLMVDNSGIGRDSGRSWHEFRVVDRLQEENNVVLEVPEKVQVGCIIPINVYAPGAFRTGFGIQLADTADLDSYDLMMDGDIAYNLTDYRWDTAETITVTAYADFGGEKPVIISKTVEVCNPLMFDLSTLPGYFVYGQEDASVKLNLPQNADEMYIAIFAEGNGWREKLYERHNLTNPLNYTINPDWLWGDTRIHVDYFARAVGFEEIYGGTNIMVTAPTSQNAVLTLDEGNLNNIRTNENIKFLVSPAAGHTLTAVRFFDGHDYWGGGEIVDHYNHPDWFEDGQNAFFWCSYNHNDDPNDILTVYAEVQLDDDPEWVSTNCLRFTVKTPNGETGSYDFNDLSTITAVQGELITVEFTESENSDSYWADIFDEDGRSFNPPSYNQEGTTTVTISTVGIPEGTYYIVGRAGHNSTPGWRWKESDNSRMLIITEEGIPEPSTVTFRMPNGLNVIEEEAFAGIPAKVVEIPYDVEWIDDRAFAGSGVEEVIFLNGNTGISDSAFEGCDGLIVFGPADSNVQYWAARNMYTFYPYE